VVLDPLVSLEVILYVEDFSLFINPLVGVGAVSIHVTVSVRGSSIRLEEKYLVDRLWTLTPEIPNLVRIVPVSLWVSLLAVNEVREFYWVPYEEDWGIVTNHIIISLFSIKLYGKSPGIPGNIGEALFSCNC